MSTVFPYIIDTKVLAKKVQLKVKRLPLHLEGLYKSVRKDEKALKKYDNTVLTTGINKRYEQLVLLFVFTRIDSEFSKYVLEGQMHEAGFDSFITGIAFVGMCYFEKFESEKEKELKDV